MFINKREIIMDDKLKLVKLYLHHMLCEYLDGNYKQAKFWQTLLREINESYSEAFFHLDQYDLQRLKTISKALDNNEYSTWLYSSERKSVVFSNEINENCNREKDVVKILLRNAKLFSQVTGLQVRFSNTEQETDFGNVDIMAYSKKYALPIEVKFDLATHAIVGQILKYMRHFLYRVNYGFYRDVIGITVAKRYSKYAFDELKKHNIIVLNYGFLHGKLILSRL